MQVHNYAKSRSEPFSADNFADPPSLATRFLLFHGVPDLKILDMWDVSSFSDEDGNLPSKIAMLQGKDRTAWM
jgi:hypothetical protein